jgi:gas vesicle protein
MKFLKCILYNNELGCKRLAVVYSLSQNYYCITRYDRHGIIYETVCRINNINAYLSKSFNEASIDGQWPYILYRAYRQHHFKKMLRILYRLLSRNVAEAKDCLPLHFLPPLTLPPDHPGADNLQDAFNHVEWCAKFCNVSFSLPSFEITKAHRFNLDFDRIALHIVNSASIEVYKRTTGLNTITLVRFPDGINVTRSPNMAEFGTKYHQRSRLDHTQWAFILYRAFQRRHYAKAQRILERYLSMKYTTFQRWNNVARLPPYLECPVPQSLFSLFTTLLEQLTFRLHVNGLKVVLPIIVVEKEEEKEKVVRGNVKKKEVRKHLRQVGKELRNRVKKVGNEVRKHVKKVGKEVRKHLRHVGNEVRKHVKGVGKEEEREVKYQQQSSDDSESGVEEKEGEVDEARGSTKDIDDIIIRINIHRLFIMSIYFLSFFAAAGAVIAFMSINTGMLTILGILMTSIGFVAEYYDNHVL